MVWDRLTGKPVYPAIVWQDRRTADRCKELKAAGLTKMVRDKTGLLLDPYFSGTKIGWILDHVGGARARAERGELLAGTVDTWLIWKLTEGALHVTDVTNASRTLLFNIHNLNWDPEMLELLGVPESMMPEVRSSAEVYGTVGDGHIFEGIPIAGIAGDQHAALFGQACFDRGMAKNTLGTGSFMLMNTGQTPVSSNNNLLTTLAWKIGDHAEYALEGSVFVSGAVIQWLRDALQLIQTAAECDELASQVADTQGVYLVPAFTGLGAPHWDPFARGILVGLTRGASRAHICRAALEAIAYQSADLIGAMEKDAGHSLSELRVDGGVARSIPFLQFQADLLQRPVVRPQTVETTALGAAYLAGIGVGFFPDRDSIRGQWQEDLRIEPQGEPGVIRQKYAGWHRAVERAKSWEEAGVAE